MGESFLGSCRFQLSLALFWGTFVHYASRMAFNFGIICMVKPYQPKNITANGSFEFENSSEFFLGGSSIDSSDYFDAAFTDSNGTRSSEEGICTESLEDIDYGFEGEFSWDRSEEATMLAAFFYGYLPMQFFGGWLATRLGARWVLFAGMLTGGACALLTPQVARWSPYHLTGLRALMGFAMGVTFPCLNTVIGPWSPPTERGVMLGIANAGVPAGGVFAGVLTGFLCQYSWTIAHYILGSLIIAWCFYWLLVAYNSPATHPRITEHEKHFIQQSLGQTLKKDVRISIPWFSLLTSRAVWAIVAGHTSLIWLSYFLTMGFPLYMQDVHRFNIKQNAALVALPAICSAVFTPLAGMLTDFLAKNVNWSLGTVRKVMESIAHLGATTFIMILAFLDCSQRWWTSPLIGLTFSIIMFCRGGTGPNPQDIAPRYCGVIYGLANTAGQTSGLLLPLAIGNLTTNGTQEEWQVLFYITAGILVAGNLIFVIFGSGEIQEWAQDSRIVIENVDTNQDVPPSYEEALMLERSNPHI